MLFIASSRVAAMSAKVKVHVKNQVFHPTNLVEGVVEVQLKSQISFNAIRVKFTGKERNRVPVERVNAEGKKYDAFDQERILFFKQVITVAGEMKTGGDSKKLYTAAPGTYFYPFVFELPANLPSSYSHKISGAFAETLYYVKAYVDGAQQGAAHLRLGGDKQHLKVIRPMPLSQHNQGGAPLLAERPYHLVYCCCCDSGNMLVRFHVQRTEVAADRDNLQIVCEIDNTVGQKPVQKFKAELFHTVTMRSLHHVKTQTKRVSKLTLNPTFGPGDNGAIAGFIPVPRDMQPTSQGFNCYSTYRCHVELHVPRAGNPTFEFPVQISETSDPTNSVPPIVFSELGYNNFVKAQEVELAYVVPSKPVHRANVIPDSTPSGAHKCKSDFTVPVLGLPSPTWQEIFPQVDGKPVKPSEAFVWEAGCGQTFCVDPERSPTVVFPDGVKQGIQHREVKIASKANEPAAATTATEPVAKKESTPKADTPPKKESPKADEPQ